MLIQRGSTTLEVILADTWRRIQAPVDASTLSAFFHRKPFKEALALIDRIVLDLIKLRQADAHKSDDVLSRLIEAYDVNASDRLSKIELRDAVVTLLLACHETTANALACGIIHAAKEFSAADPAHIFQRPSASTLQSG